MHVQGKGGRDKPVDAVHDAAMTRNEAAGILHAVAPLDPGFEQVAGLRDDRQHERDQRQHQQIADAGQRRRAATPATTPPTAPPSAPLHVLPGEIDGASFGPPTARPTK